MTDYTVIRDCYHRQRLYRAGERVRLPKGVEPPHHFETLNPQATKPKPAKAKKASPAQINQAPSKSRGAKPSKAGA